MSFSPVIHFMGLKARIQKWFAIPFSSGQRLVRTLHHDLSTSRLDKTVIHVISLVSFLWLWFSLFALLWTRIKGFWKLPDGRDCPWGNLGLVLMGGVMLSKYLIQFSVGGLGCDPSLLFGLRTYAHIDIQCPWPHSRPLLNHASTWDSQTLIGKPSSVSCGDTASSSWILVGTKFYFCSPRVCFLSPVDM